MWTVPNRIGRYEIKGRIASGGMGALYLARDTNPTTERLVAVKLLRAAFDSDDFRQRFVREAQSLAELNHPNIVTIHDSGEFEESPFIVMEYVRGETLAESIKRRAPMLLAQKLRVLAELCDGLAHAHELGIIHRDIKPANLMVDVHGRLKILDFGIARVMDSSLSSSDGLTRVNVQIGTPGYMSPEQLEGGKADARSDIFAVGAVAYELIAYREAFPGTTAQIERRLLGAQPIPVASSIPGLDPELAAAIASALEKDVQRRCQHASTLGHAFERVRARLGEEERVPRVTPSPGPGLDRKSRRERAADVAYQRALASQQEGALGFARRSAMEALAEDPRHADARKLLMDLGHLRDVEPWLPAATGPGAPTAAETRLTAPTVAPGPPAPVPPSPVQPSPGPASASEERTVLLDAAIPPVAAVPPVAPQPSQPAPPLGADQATGPQSPSSPVLPPERTVLWQPAAAPPEAPRGPAPQSEARTVLWQPAVAPPLPEQPGPLPPSAPPLPEERTVLLDAPKAPPGVERTVLWQGPLPSGQPPGVTAPSASQAPATQPLPAVQPQGGVAVQAPSTAPQKTGTQPATPAKAAPQAKAAQAKPGKQPKQPRRLSPLALVGIVIGLAAIGAAGALAVRMFWPAGGEMLTVTRPTGGTIRTDDGIECGTKGTVCSASRPRGATVQLQALADEGFVFSGWIGDCASGGRAVMSAARTCGATFSPAGTPPVQPNVTPAEYVLTIDPPTGGTIQGPGIACGTLGTDCSIKQPGGAQVTLTAQADNGFTFAAFTGNCAPSGVVTMTEAGRCGATFVAATPTDHLLTIAKPTNGTILGPGIKCGVGGAQCESRQRHGVSVALTYEAEKGFKFAAFTGDCNAAGRTRMMAARKCGATFVKEAVAPATALLTVARPTGGTIIGAGIECGTTGTQCSAEIAHGSSVVLKAQPDAGFKFVAFTGECDANGALLMTAPRNCGATFAAAPAVTRPAAGSWTTNLPNTTVSVTHDANRMTVVFGGDAPFAGYTATLKGNGREYAGDATRPGCEAPSKVNVTLAADGVFVGQFELRACNGRRISKTGMNLREVR